MNRCSVKKAISIKQPLGKQMTFPVCFSQFRTSKLSACKLAGRRFCWLISHKLADKQGSWANKVILCVCANSLCTAPHDYSLIFAQPAAGALCANLRALIALRRAGACVLINICTLWVDHQRERQSLSPPLRRY
jgi:hypothetical protein